MSLHAYVTYVDSSIIDSTGTLAKVWRAHIKLREPYNGPSLSQTYAQLQVPREPKPLLTDTLTVSADSLDEARSFALVAIEELTGIQPLLARSVDLRHLNASPAVVEEFKVAKDARKAA